MTKEPLTALAERVEGLTGPCRATDFAVWNSTGTRYDTGKYEAHYCPAYTASLDAAMTLLDQYGVLLHLSDIGADGLPLARVGRPDLPDVPIFAGIASCTMTDASPVAGLAIALTAAALRSRGGSHEQG